MQEDEGDVNIWGLWYWQVEAIIESKLGNADKNSYKYEPMAAFLDWGKQNKKDKHGKHLPGSTGTFFSVCSLYWWHAREGSPGRTRKFESNHGSENGQTHFASAGMYKWSNQNSSCKIALTYDLQILTHQSHAVQEPKLGPGGGESERNQHRK